MRERAATLVLDEHLAALRKGLEQRLAGARTVGEFGSNSSLDPDMIRAVSSGMGAEPWVLLTMDATIPDEHPNFEWERYAIAWILIEPHLRGIEVERAKAEVVRRHLHEITEQRPGDLFAYTRYQRHRAPPSLGSTLRRSDAFRR